MLAVEKRDDDSEAYLSFKDRETEIKWPFLSCRKYQKKKKIFLTNFEQKSNEAKPSVDYRARSWFFIIMKLISIATKNGCCRAFK